MLNWLKLVIIVIIIVVLASAGWLIYNNLQNTPLVNEPPKVSNEPAEVTVIPINNEQPATPINKEEQSLKALALSFASRFGSYSTAVRFQNLKDLNYIYTAKMKYWAENIINSNTISPDYYSVTTRALSAEILNQSDSSAEVLVNTQRQEVFVIGGLSQLRYEKILLQFEKISSEWKVDSAIWQK
ncbi:MAG: hypothetical protein V1712_01905 [Patescibacteria group bacterium]